MKWLLSALLMSTLAFLNGCETANSGFCAVASPIRPSVSDHLTEGTQRQILAHNEYGRSACHWRP